jgi:hypothetical protein
MHTESVGVLLDVPSNSTGFSVVGLGGYLYPWELQFSECSNRVTRGAISCEIPS